MPNPNLKPSPNLNPNLSPNSDPTPTQRCNVIALPSTGKEGLPNVLLETNPNPNPIPNQALRLSKT